MQSGLKEVLPFLPRTSHILEEHKHCYMDSPLPATAQIWPALSHRILQFCLCVLFVSRLSSCTCDTKNKVTLLKSLNVKNCNVVCLFYPLKLKLLDKPLSWWLLPQEHTVKLRTWHRAEPELGEPMRPGELLLQLNSPAKPVSLRSKFPSSR